MKKNVRKNKVKKFLQGLKKVKIKTGKFRMDKKIKEFKNAIPMDNFSIHQDNPDFWYRAVEQDEFPMGQYLKDKTGRGITHNFKNDYNRGSKICHHLSDLNNLIKKYGFTQIYLCDTYDDEEKVINSRVIYEISDSTGAVLLNAWNVPTFLTKSSSDKKTRVYLSLYSNINPHLYDSIKKELISSYKINRIPQNNVNLVIASPGGYDTEQFDLPKQKIDIELNYGKDFVPVHKKIMESLNTPKSKGLVLLHGDPGTGKTHYLKYIASKVKDKKVLFIPPYLADFITSPEMTPFLIDNANSVLFIEDAERAITDRTENGSTGVSNILNITDGILSDILNIQIVATFNMDRQKIDPALLRKGRLIAEHKFGALSAEESNKLIQHLNLDYTAEKPMTLTEIYNCKDAHYISESPYKRRIGFGSN